MSKKAATKAEREHMGRVASMGCAICKMPAEVHHLPTQGGQKDNMRVIPLCPLHHRHGQAGIAIHSGRESFEKAFDTTEEKLLAQITGVEHKPTKIMKRRYGELLR